MKQEAIRVGFPVMVWLFLVAMLFGCASRPQVDWASRIGNYTYDQAVLELGPPDKATDLSDGTKVAEWVESRRRRGGMSFGFGTGFSRGGMGVGVGQSIGSGRSVQMLRLTFGADGKLRDWRRT